MADEDPNLSIRATLDSSGVVSGGQAGTTAIGGVTAATKEAQAVADMYSVSLGTAERALAILAAPAGQATAALTELDAAMDLAQGEARAAATANAAYAASLVESAEAVMAEGAALDAVGGVSKSTATQMAALGIEMSAVTAKATELGISAQIAAAAMIKIQKAAIAGEVADARMAMEGLTVATAEEAAAAETAAGANELDAEALAQRAIMMRRTSDGLIDLAMGGRRAIQGVADLQFVLTKAVPEAAVLFSILGGIGIIAELWESASRKMERAHTEAMEKVKTNIDQYAASIRDVLELQSDLEKADDQRISRLTTALQIQKEYISTQREAADAEIESDALAEEQGKTREEREKIERAAARKEKEAAGQDKIETAKDELETKRQSATALGSKITDEQGSLSDDQQELLTKQRSSRYAHDLLASQGINLDSSGQLPKGATDADEKALADAHAKLQQAEEEQRRGYARGLYGEKLQAEKNRRFNAVGSAETGVQNAEERLAETRMAPAIIKESEDAQKTLTARIKETSQKIDDDSQKLSDQQKEIVDAQTALATATRQLANIRARDAIEQEDDETKGKLTPQQMDEMQNRSNSKKSAPGNQTLEKKVQDAKDQLNSDRESLENYQNNVREIAAHTVTTATLGRKHAEQTAVATQTTREALASMQEAILHDNEQLRLLQEQVANSKLQNKASASQ
jgi:hypothetical protein